MRRSLLWFLLGPVSGCALSGCVTLTSFETGRAIGKGESAAEVSVASGAYSEVSIDGDRDDVSDESLPLDYVPVPGIKYTYGAGPRTDVGISATMATFVAVHAKHQLIGTRTSPIAVAVGAEAGGNFGAFSFGFGYAYANASAVASYHPSPGLAVFASSRYTDVTVHPISPPPESERLESSGWAFPSVSYGIAVGDRRRVAVEVSHTDFGTLVPAHVAVGVRLRLP